MLIFKYGTMSSSKTAQALILEYQCRTKGLNVILYKPNIDTRDGKDIISSRIGLSKKCELIYNDILHKNTEEFKKYDKIIIDEAQFLTKAQVDYFSKIVDKFNIDVICFGLKTDFKTNLFPGSKRLLEIADKIEEIENTCWCGEKAIFNARVDKNGNICKKGEQVKLGKEDLYVSLCRKHFNENLIRKNE